MEREGYVSLWIGNFKSDEELLKYVELIYTEDGDCLPSQFLQDFNIYMEDFDEDFIESICLEKEVISIVDLISGCSYEDVIIPKYENLVNMKSSDNINAGILLYNFQYDESVKLVNNDDYKFKFVGTVEYK